MFGNIIHSEKENAKSGGWDVINPAAPQPRVGLAGKQGSVLIWPLSPHGSKSTAGAAAKSHHSHQGTGTAKLTSAAQLMKTYSTVQEAGQN